MKDEKMKEKKGKKNCLKRGWAFRVMWRKPKDHWWWGGEGG